MGDPYITKLVNQELKKVEDKQKSDDNWIEKRLKMVIACNQIYFVHQHHKIYNY